MNYYIMCLEERFSYAPDIINWYHKFDVRNICKKKAHLLPERELLEIRPSRETIFTDIISSPFLLVSETVKEIIQVYEPTIEYKDMVLLDTRTPQYALYYLPVLETIDCLSMEKTKFNALRGAILRMVLDKQKIEDKSIFKLVYLMKSYVIVRLDLSESLLRRDLLGVGLQKVECV